MTSPTASFPPHDASDIAVVGMSCRLPGAPDVDALWSMLVDGREGVRRTNRSSARRAGAPADLVDHPGFVPVGSDIGPIDGIDLAAFGLTRGEARYLDPQHRVLAEEVWHALDDAGHGHGSGAERVGVFAGTSPSAYLHHAFRSGFDPSGGIDPAESMQIALGTQPDYLATGIAYRMDLKGPAQTILTACSSSLVAVHAAAESLRSGESDIAVAGGVTVRVPAAHGYVHLPDGPFSQDGHTRSYGAGATGAVFTQGAGVVVLRRYDDALAAGDRIRAVIRGSAVNNDGAAKAGFVVPGVEGHAAVIAEALAGAGMRPRDIGYVEGHGTGTRLGDPVEVAALKTVFGPADAPWCRLGSIKSNIGHTEAAAGIASLIKAVLAVEHGLIPGSLHCSEPNPALGLEGSALRCADTATAWDPDRPRCAGISSLGFGGTNAHVVIVEAEEAPASDPDPRPQLWLLGAASSRSLDELVGRAGRVAEGLDHVAVPDVSGALSRSAGPRGHRAALVVDGQDGRVLDTVTPSTGRGDDDTGSGGRSDPRYAGPVPVVAACPGGGAQRVGMAEDLYRLEPDARELIDELAAVASGIVGDDLRRVCCPVAAGLPPAEPDDPLLGLPALLATTIAAGRLWLRGGIRPDAWIGHSSGEYAAAVLSGAVEASAAMHLVAHRSAALSRLEPGGMARVRGGADAVARLRDRFPGLEVAAWNSPRSTVLTGPESVVTALVDELGESATRVRISVPGHSRHVDPARESVRSAAARLRASDPGSRLYSCLTAGAVDGARLSDPDHWVEHLRRPVRFDETVAQAAADLDRSFDLVDLGPGTVLGALARECAPEGLRRVIGLAGDEGVVGRSDILRGLGELYASGHPVRTDALTRGRRGSAPLPRYPFDRTRVWAGPDSADGRSAQGSAAILRRRALRDRSAPAPVDSVPEDATVWRAEGAPLDALRRLRDLVGAQDRAEGLVVVTVDARDGDPQRTAAVLAALPAIRAEHPGLQIAGLVVEAGDPEEAGRALAADLARRASSPWQGTVHVGSVGWSEEVIVPDPGSPPAGESGDMVTGRVVVIGGLGTVGREVAASFVTSGADVTVTTRRTLNEVDPQLVPDGATVARWDGRDDAALAGILRDSQGHGPLVVVNCTGVVGQASFATLAESGTEVLTAHETSRARVWDALERAVAALGDRAPAVLVAMCWRGGGGGGLGWWGAGPAGGPRAPDVLVAMSSLASVSGGFGLSAYAVSCREVELRCERPTTPDRTRRLALAWDGWRTDGADDTAFARHLLRYALAPDHACELLHQVVSGAARGTVVVTRRPLTAEGIDIADADANSVGAGRDPGDPSSRTADSGHGAGQDTSPTLARVCALWAEAVGLDAAEIGQDSDFFALGGQSLAATRMLGTLRDQLGVDVRLRDLLDDPTPAGVLALLGEPQPVTAAPPADEVRGPRESTAPQPDAPAPLTPVQRAYLLGREDDYGVGGAACHSFVEFRAPRLDPDRFEAAFRTMLGRHPMLRTVVELDGIHEVDVRPEEFVLEVADFRSSVCPEPAASLQRWRDRLAVRSAPASRWPLVCPYLAVTDDAVHVGWSVDVLACDADSFGLLHAEMGAVYRGEDPGPDPTVTFAEHARRGASRAGREEDHRWWTQRVAQLPGAPDVSGGGLDARHAPPGGFARRRWELGPELSDSVVRASARHRTTPAALLLTAYSHMLRDMSGMDDFSVMVTTFDRPPGMTGVIGEFTELAVVGLHTAASPVSSLDAVGRALFDALDRSSVSGIDVLAMRTTADGERFSVPVVFTSTLGAEGASGFDDAWSGALVEGISQTPQVVLDHQVYRWNGTIVAQWDHLVTVVGPDRMERALQVYRRAVRDLVGDDYDHDDDENAAENSATEHRASEHDTGDNRAADLLDLVRARWADVLDIPVDEIGPDDAFLALGGESLTAVRAVAGLRGIGVSIPVAAVLEGMTPREIAERASVRGWRHEQSRPPELVRASPGQPFPLTSLQQAYWIGQQGGWQLSDDAAHFVVDFFDPSCDPDRLRAAARRLVEFQPMLRAIITEDGYQQILDVDDPRLAPDPVEIVDLRTASEEEIARAIEQTRSRWQVDGPDPGRWPSFRIRAHLLPDGGARVHVSAALVFVDGWSFYLFFDQLLTFHDEPNARMRAPSVTFADHVATLTAAAEGPDVRRARENWRRRIPDLPQAPPVPVRSVPDHIRRMERRGFRLGPEAASALRDWCRDRRVTPTAVFGAAYARALGHWCEADRFLLTVLYFNRPQISDDIDRVLGAFSSTVLVDVTVPDSTDVVAHAGAFAAGVAQSLDDSAVDGVEVARQIARHRGHRGLVAPVVFTSTLGFDDPTADSVTSRIDPTDVWERVRTPQVLVDMQVAAEHDGVVCNIDCPEGVVDPEDHRQLVNRVQAFVEAAIDDIGLAPGPRPPAGAGDTRSDRSGDSPRPGGPPLVHLASMDVIEVVRGAIAAQVGAVPADTADFFTEGGDSLGLVRALNEIRRRTGVAVAPRDVVDRPTITHISALVEQGRTTAAERDHGARPAPNVRLHPDTHLVPLSSDGGRPLYLLHPSGGDVLCYADLAVELDGYRVLALPDPRYAGTPMPDDLGVMVRAYTDLVVSAHGDDPAPPVLGGWSMGGTVAHDVAVELRSRGVRVGAVVMIDSTTPDRIRRISGLVPDEVGAETALRYLRSVEAFAGRGVDSRDETRLRRRLADSGGDSGRSAVLEAGLRGAGLAGNDARRRLEVFTSHLAGLAEHRARSLEGAGVPVLLVRAGRISPVNSGVGMGVDDATGDGTLGWQAALGERSTVVEIDAHHYSVLRDPAVIRVGAVVREFLAGLSEVATGMLDAPVESAARPEGVRR